MKKEKKGKQSKEKNKIRIWIENIVEILIVIICITFSIIVISSPGGIKEDIHKTNVNYMPVLSESMSGTFEKGDIIFGDKLKKGEDGKYPILDIGEVAIFIVVQNNVKFINTHRVAAYYYEYKDSENTFKTGYKDMIGVESVVDAKSANDFAISKGWTDFKITGYKTSGDNKAIYYKDGVIGGELIVPSNTDLVDSGHVEIDDVIGTWNGKKIGKLGGAITWLQKPLNFFLVILIPLILLFLYNIWIVVKYIIEMKTEKARKLALEEASANSNGSISAEEEEEIKRKAVEEYMKKMGIDPNSLPKKEDSSNDNKEEKVDVVEPTSEEKVVDDEPVVKKTTKKSTTSKKSTKSSKKDDVEKKD